MGRRKPMKQLTTALGDYPHLRALLAGEVAIPGYELRPVEVRPIISAYRQMVRDLAFDVCELAPVTYLMALEAGVPITGIPVFLNRRFHHGDLRCALADRGPSRPQWPPRGRPGLFGEHRRLGTRCAG
jgi:4,5-dihydroxyphthalate decarboxylase